jgi:hypothetical protein
MNPATSGSRVGRPPVRSPARMQVPAQSVCKAAAVNMPPRATPDDKDTTPVPSDPITDLVARRP